MSTEGYQAYVRDLPMWRKELNLANLGVPSYEEYQRFVNEMPGQERAWMLAKPQFREYQLIVRKAEQMALPQDDAVSEASDAESAVDMGVGDVEDDAQSDQSDDYRRATEEERDRIMRDEPDELWRPEQHQTQPRKQITLRADAREFVPRDAASAANAVPDCVSAEKAAADLKARADQAAQEAADAARAAAQAAADAAAKAAEAERLKKESEEAVKMVAAACVARPRRR